MPPVFGRQVGRRRGDPSSGRKLHQRRAAILRRKADGIDSVGEHGAAVGRAAGLQAADRAGQRQDARIMLRRRMGGGTGVKRGMFDDFTVVRPEKIEAAIQKVFPEEQELPRSVKSVTVQTNSWRTNTKSAGEVGQIRFTNVNNS